MTAYSGLWDGFYNTPYTLQVARSSLTRRVGALLKRRGITRIDFALKTVQTGQSINAGSAVQYKREQSVALPGDPSVLGGKLTMEQRVQIAGGSSTTTADVANIAKLTAYKSKPTSYPVDKSGNGGGSKLA